jgi:hypothetical protein
LIEPIALRIGGDRYAFSEGKQRAASLELACDREDRDGHASVVRLRIRNPGDHEQSLPDITVELDPVGGLVLEHGWQSWSVVRRCSPSDVRPRRAKTARWERARLLTDPGLAGEAVVGEPFLVSEAGVVGFLAGSANFAIVAEHDLLGKVRSLSGPADTPLEIAGPFAEALEVKSRASVLAIDWDGRGEPPPSPGAGSAVIDATGPAGLAWARLDGRP